MMEAIRKMNAPEIAEEMRSLLGLSDYVFRMIPHFATITEGGAAPKMSPIYCFTSRMSSCACSQTCLTNLQKHVALCFTLLNIYVSAESSIYFNKDIRPNNDHCGIKHNFQFETSPSTTTPFRQCNDNNDNNNNNIYNTCVYRCPRFDIV